MKFNLEPLTPEDRDAVIDIFNYYIEYSFSAYPENIVPYESFDTFLKMTEGYPTVAAKDENGDLLGFGMLRPYNPIPTFSQTAEITYFIKPGFTGKGLGKSMLDYLIEKAQEKRLSSILASISSLNEGSIRFHKKNGFVECGRFQKVGKKNNQVFDIVYMQKIL